jgi:hypothetical protein
VTLAWTLYFALSAMLSLACLHWHHWPGGRFYAAVLTPVSLG